MISDQGLCCDVCGELLKGTYVHLPARTNLCDVWGWIEGHEKCVDDYAAKQAGWELGAKEYKRA